MKEDSAKIKHILHWLSELMNAVEDRSRKQWGYTLDRRQHTKTTLPNEEKTDQVQSYVQKDESLYRTANYPLGLQKHVLYAMHNLHRTLQTTRTNLLFYQTLDTSNIPDEKTALWYTLYVDMDVQPLHVLARELFRYNGRRYTSIVSRDVFWRWGILLPPEDDDVGREEEKEKEGKRDEQETETPNA